MKAFGKKAAGAIASLAVAVKIVSYLSALIFDLLVIHFSPIA